MTGPLLISVPVGSVIEGASLVGRFSNDRLTTCRRPTWLNPVIEGVSLVGRFCNDNLIEEPALLNRLLNWSWW